MASVSDVPEKLVTAAVQIQNTPVKDAGEISFTPKLMALVGLPHRDPKSRFYVRRNGNLRMTLADPTDIGIPFGVIPRLALVWMTTEVIRTKSKNLMLGDSLNQYMRKLDIVPSGGRLGSTKRVLNQLDRLFSSVLTIHYEDELGQGRLVRHAPITTKFTLWTGRDPDQTQLWESMITLTEEFYTEIINHPVPLDMRVLKGIKQSPLALDYYLWRTYRNSYMMKETAISLKSLQAQFGAGYANNREGRNNFQRAFQREATRVQALYRAAKFRMERGRVILIPGEPSVPKLSTDTGE